MAQLNDQELATRPREDANSVAIILRHLGGNLRSRWTDFLSTDGEKPDRDRDREFLDWDGDRRALLAYFDTGWQALLAAISQLNATNLQQTIKIRGEAHTLPQALIRSLTHVAYHAGQINLIAREVHAGPWKWLTIAPHSSREHNRQTWGTAASRSVMGKQSE